MNSNMPAAGTISNEMLYELIRDFKSDVYRRLDSMRYDTDKQFASMRQDIESMRNDTDRQFTEVRELIRDDKQKLQAVYESRDRVTVNFTRAWMFSSFFIALIASTIVLAVANAF